MEFEWDEDKRLKVMRERGVDFADVALIFENPVWTRRDNRRDYGEPRWRSVGMVEDECYVAIHTWRGEKIRLVTAWKGGRDEESEYKARYPR
jgi:uncharacterized DUF497 family protein